MQIIRVCGMLQSHLLHVGVELVSPIDQHFLFSSQLLQRLAEAGLLNIAVSWQERSDM